jgi:hypothetical protein
MVYTVTLIAMSAALFSVTACKERSQPVEKATVYDNDSITFYPVKDFLQSQINAVSSTPYFIYQTTVRDGHKDSVVLNRLQFLAATSLFTAFSFEDTTVKKFYKEEAFGDQSNSITLRYTTKNDSLPVQSATVLLQPGTNKVKRIMLEVVESNGDSTVIRKLGWKNNESCSIITLIQKKGQPEQSTQSLIVWNGN